MFKGDFGQDIFGGIFSSIKLLKGSDRATSYVSDPKRGGKVVAKMFESPTGNWIDPFPQNLAKFGDLATYIKNRIKIPKLIFYFNFLTFS